MDRAMDLGSSGRGRRLVGFLAGLSLATAGCAQWNSRATDSSRLAATAPPSADPYLARQRPITAPTPIDPSRTGPGPDLVRSTIHPGPVSTVPAARPQPEASTDTRPASRTDQPAADPQETVRAVVAQARARLDAMSNYQVQMNRQEKVGGQLLLTEDVLLSVRREPRAVRLEWPTGPSRGREVIFSSTDPRGLLHVHMGNPLVPAVSMRPDSPLVMRNSRHPITEAGFGTIIENLEKGLAGGTPGATIAYHGIDVPPAVGRPCHQIVRRTPLGENWMVFIDVQTGLPAMVAETTSMGELLERYIFRDVNANLAALSSPDAFDPEKRWAASGGLLGRLSRSGTGDVRTTVTPPPQ